METVQRVRGTFMLTPVWSYERKLRLLFQNTGKYFQEILCGNIHLKGDEVFAITEKCFVEKFEHPVLAQSEKK